MSDLTRSILSLYADGKSSTQISSLLWIEEESVERKLKDYFYRYRYKKDEKMVVTPEILAIKSTDEIASYGFNYYEASNIVTYSELWVKTINKIGAKNTNLLTIEYIFQKTKIPRAKIKKLLEEKTTSEIIAWKELIKIDKREFFGLENSMCHLSSSMS